MKVEREIDIAAAPEAVYAVLMDAGRLEDWVTIHVELLDAPDQALTKGSKLTQRLKLAGKCFNVRWTVVENERARRVVWRGRGPMRSKATAIYDLAPDGEGTRFSYTNEYDLPGGPLGRLAGPVVSRVTAGELDRSLQRLRRLVEERHQRHPEGV
jgi:carbon monoxide dehydrogenase subunit G